MCKIYISESDVRVSKSIYGKRKLKKVLQGCMDWKCDYEWRCSYITGLFECLFIFYDILIQKDYLSVGRPADCGFCKADYSVSETVL